MLNDGEAFIAKLEEVAANGDAGHIGRNVKRPEGLIAHLMEENYRIAGPQYRARLVRDQHGPTADERRG